MNIVPLDDLAPLLLKGELGRRLSQRVGTLVQQGTSLEVFIKVEAQTPTCWLTEWVRQLPTRYNNTAFRTIHNCINALRFAIGFAQRRLLRVLLSLENRRTIRSSLVYMDVQSFPSILRLDDKPFHVFF